MQLAPTRIFAYFTLMAYLVVGSLAVRFYTQESLSVTLDTNYFSVLTKAKVDVAQVVKIKLSNHHFAEIKFPAIKARKIISKTSKIVPSLWAHKINKNELPFHEPFQLTKVYINTELEMNHLALFVPAPHEKIEMVAQAETSEVIADEVTTKMAKSHEVTEEPEFFEYEEKKINTKVATTEQINAEEKVNSPVEGIEVESSQEEKVASTQNIAAEEIEVDQLLAFDYPRAAQDIKEQKIPTISKVSTQAPTRAPEVKVNTQEDNKEGLVANEGREEQPYKSLPKSKTHFSRVTIQATGTDLKRAAPLNGFELRFRDDESEAAEDFGSGEVVLEQGLSEASMTRSTSILKRGFVPTNTDLILETGVGAISVPLIEEEIFNKLIGPYEPGGPVGAVLIELDDDSEIAELDVPFGKVIRLDGNLRKTSNDDYRYMLYLGVKVGNAFLSYKHMNGEIISKIIHVHEREVTFEANYFEPVINKNVSLYEEDLLAKEKAPLITAAQNVKVFATNKESEKINDHTYRVNVENSLLASRRYLELTHQEEPVFVGIKEKVSITVPSESFMRHVLSRIEGRLANRCLIQVNLSKTATRVDVGSESVGNSLVAYTQILDSDGKFYESVSEKSRNVIILGESHATAGTSSDAKINVKITYEDESVQFLGSYCSPNTYLVEQL